MSLRQDFLIDPQVIFLNHGSFGACPRPVLEAYQNWQLALERQPVEFLGRKALSLLADAREVLAGYLGCRGDELVYFPNPTTAINMVARSLDLKPGDEILATNHEYGAMDRTWRYICQVTGAKYVQQHIPLPMSTHDNFLDTFWEGVTGRTRLIFISHITSPTALVFPVEAVCRRAREAGILSIVDGAHAPGQIPVDLSAIGADIYTGACHKWMLAPKGSSFLYARPEVQGRLAPLVVSWGYDPDPGFGSGNPFIDTHEWQGTRDLAAYLAVPAAIAYMADHHWDQVRKDCRQLALKTRQRINTVTGFPPVCPPDEGWLGQMFCARLPALDSQSLKHNLLDLYKIEVPITRWNDQNYIRVSVQGYNTAADMDTLLEALKALLEA